jgi:GH24 family phage-related lysozyme (muramidase)
MANRTLSTVGLEMIKGFEGLRLKAYKTSIFERYYTIGYGHYGKDVSKNMTITEAQATDLLLNDCTRFVANINSYMDKYNFTQNQFDALVSFAFNIGGINQLTQNGTRSIAQISAKFPEYNHSGGKVNAGLTARRLKEKALFDKPEECPAVPSRFVQGSCVVYSSCYDSSTDPVSKAHILPEWKQGVISFVRDAPNGYAISDKVGGTIRCWCNAGDFR